MLNIDNPIVSKMIQNEKENYIANRIIKALLFENCSQDEYRNILKSVEERLLGKSIYEYMEYEETTF